MLKLVTLLTNLHSNRLSAWDSPNFHLTFWNLVAQEILFWSEAETRVPAACLIWNDERLKWVPDVVRYVNFIKVARESFKLSLFRFPDKDELLNFIIFSYRWFLFLIYFLTKAPLSSFWNFLPTPLSLIRSFSHSHSIPNLSLCLTFAPTYPEQLPANTGYMTKIINFFFFKNDLILHVSICWVIFFTFIFWKKETPRCHSSFKKLFN